eukprot:TRINITY_DN23112_c0_g2_i2.p1 TRINITY_DN23112_c0_g2~~TRINITY_DN23112_c0_g2_i2.p1  ORF type:complete len:259 (+),score=59.51 TRINITY_DN23112_c0_g2_i2:65-841(+)
MCIRDRNGLLHSPRVQSEDNFQLNRNLKNEFTPCFCIDELRKSFCECSIEATLKPLRKYFSNRRQAIMFDALFQETMQILAACVKNSIVAFTDSLEDLFVVADCFPLKIAAEIKAALDSFLKIVWQLALLFFIEEDSNSLRLAGNLMRMASLGLNEQDELGFIRQSLAMLKSVEYDKVDVSKIRGGPESIEELGNAFALYTNKRGSIIKAEKAGILAMIMQKNLKVYDIIAKQSALSLIHICRCRRIERCRSRWSPYH